MSIREKIQELESEMENMEFGSYEYDCWNLEVEMLYIELDKESK